MGSFRVATDIRRPASEVFAFVADPQNMPRWYDAVERVIPLTPTSQNAGSYRITRSLPGGRADNTVDVTASTSDLSVTFTSDDEPTPFRYRYTITRRGENNTRLVLDAEISSTGLPGPLSSLDAIATAAFKRGMYKNLAQLKQLIETTSRQRRAALAKPRAQ